MKIVSFSAKKALVLVSIKSGRNVPLLSFHEMSFVKKLYFLNLLYTKQRIPIELLPVRTFFGDT